MANIQTVSDRVQMAQLPSPTAGEIVFLAEPPRHGLFQCTTGSVPVSDPQQGLYVASAVSGFYYARLWDGVYGRPEWFGARINNRNFDCLTALSACIALCQTTRLQAADYYIKDGLTFSESGKILEGSAGSGSEVGIGTGTGLGTAGGTRIILTGANVVGSTILQFGRTSGARDDQQITRNSFVRNIKFARDCSVYKPRPSTTDDPIDCVKGVIMSFISTSGMVNVKSYDSPVGFHCFGVVNSTLDECNSMRVTAASSPERDFYVGFLVGGYDGANFGYIGANASIYLHHCTAFDQNPAFDTSIGLKLFGYIADTFIYDFETARLDFGIVVDGSGRNGQTISNANGPGAHQDVTIDKAVIDATNAGGSVVRNLNDFNSLMITNPYVVTAPGTIGIDITNAAGIINITQGKILGYQATGVHVANVNGFSLKGVQIRDCSRPVVLENCGMFDVEPVVFALTVGTSDACTLSRCFRGYLRPQINGAPGLIAHGVRLDGACNYMEVNGSAIDPGALIGVSAANKVLFAGADARVGSGAAAFAAASCLLSGVTG